MEHCKNHPLVESVTRCSACGVPLCDECVAPGDGDPVCFDCSIARTEQQLGQERAAEPAAAPGAAPPPARRLSPAVKATLVLGLIVILGELAIILFLASPGPAENAPAPPLTSEQAATIGATAETIVVTQALEAFKARTGHYPEDLSEIAGSLPAALRERINDPSTVYSPDGKGGYRLEIRGDAPYPVVSGTDLQAPVVKGVNP